ncbi:MAG: hypothetical protein WDA21_00365 [Bacilli bacterium]
MDVLKKENWWIWLLLYVFAGSVPTYVLGALLGVYKKDAWYAKWQNWLIGFLFFIFPVIIMFTVFSIQITIEVAKKLKVPNEGLYANPTIWILGFIIPIIGWLGLGILSIYIIIYILINLYNGKGEKYIKD